MNKYVRIFLILSLCAAYVSCSLFGIQGSGRMVESRFVLDDFTSVNAAYTCDVTISRGDSFSIIVTIDDNILPYLETYLSGNTLHIDLQSGHYYNNINFKAVVTMPYISSLNLSGASEAVVRDFENSGDFRVNISGASHGEIHFVSSQNILCEVSGASNLTVHSENSAGNVSIECSGASISDLRNITAHQGSVNISGASRAYVNLSGRLKGTVSGASTLYYRGTPAGIDVNVSGASHLTRM